MSSGKFTRGIDLAGVSGNICDGAGGSIAMKGRQGRSRDVETGEMRTVEVYVRV